MFLVNSDVRAWSGMRARESECFPELRWLWAKAGLRKPQVRASPPGLRLAMTVVTVGRDAEHTRDLASISDSLRIRTETAMGKRLTTTVNLRIERAPGRNRRNSRDGLCRKESKSVSQVFVTRRYARNSAALSVAHSMNVFAGAPVISATVEVTCAGWPIAAAQASSSMFTAGNGPILSNSRRASSGVISWMRSVRPITPAIVDTCSDWLSDCGPVRTYSAPACRSSHNARTATEAMSRSSIGAVGAARYGQRTTSPARICGAHQVRAFAANIPGRRNVH